MNKKTKFLFIFSLINKREILTILAFSRFNSSTSFVDKLNLFSYVSSCALSSLRTKYEEKKETIFIFNF